MTENNDRKDGSLISQAPQWRQQITAVGEDFGLLVRVTGGLGILTTGIYSLSTRSVPQGLTIGDTGFILAVSLAAGLIDLFVIGISVASMFWSVALVSAVVRKWGQLCTTQNRDKSSVGMPSLKHGMGSWSVSFGSLVLFLFVAGLVCLLLDLGSFRGKRLLGLMIIFGVCGFLAIWFAFVQNTIHSGTPDPGQTASPDGCQLRTAVNALLVFLIPIIMYSPVLASLAMVKVGVRYEDTAVIVSSENFDRLRSTAAIVGATLHSCKPAAGSGWLVFGLQLHWHGIGDSTYGQLLLDEGAWNRGPSYVTVKLRDEGVQPVRSNLRVSCSAGQLYT